MQILKSKKNLVAILILSLSFILIALGIFFFSENNLKQIHHVWTHEAGEELILSASDFFDGNEKKIANISFDTSAVDTDVTGTYTAIAYLKNKTFEIQIKVTDTTAPVAEFSNRYVFTNDITNTDFTDTLSGVYDASEWSVKLIRFAWEGSLQVMDKTALKSLSDSIVLPCNAKELNTVGTEDIPTKEGIYRAVMEISDIHGNSTLEELYVIYDTTGAYIDDTPDKIITVKKEHLEDEPEIDKNDYIITDNADGVIDSAQINCELELRNAKKHEWLALVSYIDRAGNDSRAEFLITVKEETEPSASQMETEEEPNSSDSGEEEPPLHNNLLNQIETTKNYHPEDTNKDGVITNEESAATISPDEQLAIDAGYGNVVLLASGDYAVLTHGDGYANGKNGSDILREYLFHIGFEPSSVGGCWIDTDNDWYWYIAYHIHTIDTNSLEWENGGDIEFIE